VSFANPLGLLLLTAAAPLLAMYFLKVRRKKVRVPSLLLWQGLIANQRKARPWDRFRRHDLLWLQLLALILLSLALAKPSIPGKTMLGRSVVWVVDGSASMNAKSPSPSRFEHAIDVVLGEIDQLRVGDEGMVLLAGPEPRVAASFTRDKDKLASAVRGLSPTGAAASLGGAVDLAVALSRSRPDRTLVVVTDGSDRSLDAALSRHPNLRVEEVGRGVANVAITAVDLRRSPTQDLQSELFVTLRRFGGEAGPVGVEVTLDGELVATEAVELPADRPVGRVFRDLGDEGGLVRVHVETGDALSGDDDAVVWLDPPRRRSVVCVGCTQLTARALATDARFRVDVAGSWPEEGDADLIVAEGVPVPESPGAPFLALGPTALGEDAAGPEVAWPRITEWKRTHPVMRFVEPAGLHVAKARPSTDGTWLPLIESDQGPLLSSGVVGGHRGVVMHFRPLDSDLPLRVAYPLMMLNASAWLTGEGSRSERRTLAAGEPLVREGWGEDGAEVVLKKPDGSDQRAPIRDGVARFGALDQVGVYKLLGPGGRQERLAVNLSSDAESDLAVVPHRAVDEAGEVLLASAPGRTPLTRPFLLLVALVLLMEWWLYQRKYAE
jgi:Ca-activated chloride channel homolog